MATLGRWTRTIQDGAGNIRNASVAVYRESDGLLATIYSDRAGATPKSNPFTLSDSDYGLAFFHATGGAYKIIATDGSYSQTYRYEPVGTGAEFDSDSLSGVTPPTTTVPAGIHIAEATNNGSNYVNVTVPASLTGSRTFTVPDKDVSFGTIGAGVVPFLDGANTWSAQQTLSAALNLTSGQIAFPASQSASAGANTLDDYEEGTGTSALSATGCTFSYATQNLTYIKVGAVVSIINISVELNTTGNTLAANSVSITGLPFTSTAGARCEINWANSTSNLIKLDGALGVSATTVAIRGNTAAATTSISASSVAATVILSASAGSGIYTNLNYAA